MARPVIDSVYPANAAQGVVLSDVIYVTFDREIDPTTVQILVEATDFDRVSGPDLARFDDPTTTADDNLFVTPGYHGIVDGEITFEQVDAEGESVSGFDYSGTGTLWYTKAIFIPTNPLAASTLHKIYIIGDESALDSIISGASTRTVFDPVKGANLGSGEAYLSGGYNGIAQDKFIVQIYTAGEVGTAVFRWWKESAPLQIREQTTKRSSVLLSDGVSVRFTGSFEKNDEFSVVVVPGERMLNTYTWSFTTGSGSIVTVPSSTAVSTGISGVLGSTTATEGLQIVSVTPVERATNLDPEDVEVVVVKFNKDLDEDSITDANITVWSEPVNGDPAILAEGAIAKILSVDGDTLTITFTIVGGGSVGTTILYGNNMVFVQLDENIAATDGDTLGDDYTYYFTTTYDPLYSSVRRVRLELGPFIEEVPDDTVNLAIFEASLEADALTFGPVSLTSHALQFFNFARRQYVTCVAELILLGAITSDSGGGGAKSKRLADLSITYSNNADDVIRKASACRAKWEAILTSVGALGPGTSQKPSMVVKGEYDPDRPGFGREWEPTSTYSGMDSQMPAANTRSKYNTRRRWKRDYYGNNSRWGSRFEYDD